MAELKLTTQADFFYWEQPQPKDHDDFLQIMVNFAVEISTKLLKEAAQLAAFESMLNGIPTDDCDDLHDEIMELIDQYR